MIEVNDLTKKYGDFAAVKGITFTAEPGQVTGFLGPNGAGKTTTMRMLTGYSPPTSGSAKVAGYDIFEQSMDVRKNVGYLPENVPLYRDMTARGYLMYVAEIRGVSQRRDRALDVLRRVGLASRANSRIRTLSKGMKQRVGLAAAIMHDPEVLILDEPTIGLDPLQVLELRDLVRDLGTKHTVMFSTHILSEAEQVCDKVVIINRGDILAQGAPLELRAELERGQDFIIRLEADTEEALDIVQGINAVAEARIERDAILVVPQSADVDPRPTIARTLIQSDFNVIEMRPVASSLEEIFIEVTRRAQPAEAEAEVEVQTADGMLNPNAEPDSSDSQEATT